jgi:hypothetical protein
MAGCLVLLEQLLQLRDIHLMSEEDRQAQLPDQGKRVAAFYGYTDGRVGFLIGLRHKVDIAKLVLTSDSL